MHMRRRSQIGLPPAHRHHPHLTHSPKIHFLAHYSARFQRKSEKESNFSTSIHLSNSVIQSQHESEKESDFSALMPQRGRTVSQSIDHLHKYTKQYNFMHHSSNGSTQNALQIRCLLANGSQTFVEALFMTFQPDIINNEALPRREAKLQMYNISIPDTTTNRVIEERIITGNFLEVSPTCSHRNQASRLLAYSLTASYTVKDTWLCA